MLTNAVAIISVVLITNTVSVVQQRLVSDPVKPSPEEINGGFRYAVFHGHYEDIDNPTVRTNITSCIARTNATVRGVTFPIGESVLWSTQVVEKLEWIPTSPH